MQGAKPLLSLPISKIFQSPKATLDTIRFIGFVIDEQKPKTKGRKKKKRKKLACHTSCESFRLGDRPPEATGYQKSKV
jgi:hypothetical protein